MAFLKVVKGSVPGQILDLRGERVVIGRHPSCEIVLDNAAVSRHHAQILESHGSFFVEDLRSRNRTFVNKAPIEGRTELHEDDLIRICDLAFTFHLQLPEAGESDTDTGDDQPVAVVNLTARTRSQTQTVSHEFDAIGSDGLGEADAFAAAEEQSSIISTLDARSGSSLRLAVKPEAKLRAVLGISRALANVLKIDAVLDAILDGLFQIFPQADEGFILLAEPDRDGQPGKLIVRAVKTRREADKQAARPSRTIAGQAMAGGEAILSANALQDPRFDMSESLSNLRIRSILCAPLISADGDAIGVIQIVTRNVQQYFSQDDLDLLVAVTTQAALAVENARLHEELLAQRDVQKDLEFATHVQLGFLPHQPPRLAGYEFGDYYEAAHRVGGDYFDYIELADGRVALALGDVAGKGVPAALLMARLYSACRYHLLKKPTPALALSGLNAEIASSGLGHRFITCIVAVVDPTTHRVSFANAGHLPPLLRTPANDVQSLGQKQSGFPLGVVPDQEFQEIEVELQPGDSLTLYTDGITEAMNPASDIFGRRRLTEYLARSPVAAADLIAGIVAEVDAFCEDRPQSDDMCLVCLRRLPEKPATPKSRRKPKAV